MVFDYLSAHKTFESVTEMDEHVEGHIKARYYDLTNSERDIVFTIASRSLMYPGASHLKASTIADQVGVSTKTVYRSIKKLVELGIIEKVPNTKLNGIKGANIYKVLPFGTNVPSSVSQRIEVQEVDNSTVNVVETENQSLDSFNLLRSKQASNIISLGEKLSLQSSKKKEYMNEWQITLFDFLHSLPMRDDLKDQLNKAVLASRIDNAKEFVRAKDVLLNIVRDINSGVLTVSSTLRAVFVGAHDKVIELLRKQLNKPSIVVDEPLRVRPVPFYNWLVERD